jgi:hypothetical protein
MRDTAAIDAFWARFVTRAPASAVHTADDVAARLARCSAPLPRDFVALTTRGVVERVAAPELRVGPVGDWLAHAVARHVAMRAFADVHGNPRLARMVPFGDTAAGLEVALELGADGARVVWLDPAGYDSGDAAVVGLVADDVMGFVAAQLANTRAATG